MQSTYPTPTEPPVVGGYKLVRILGEGEKARVHLGFTANDDVAAIKVFDARSSSGDIDIEAEALSRAPHAHIVKLLDIARNALVLERLEWGSLARLLASRSSLTDGEIATIIAPLGAALDTLHDGGVAHNAIHPSAVLFRADGAPVLARFGTATLERAGLTIAAQEHVTAFVNDRRAFLALASLVLDKAAPRSVLDPVRTFINQQLESGCVDPVGLALAEKLFRAVVPEPVAFSDDAAALAPPQRAIGPVPAPEHADNRRSRRKGRRRREPWSSTTIAEGMDVSPVAALRAAVAARLGSSKRRAVVLFCGIAVAGVLVAAVVPSDSEAPPAHAVSSDGAAKAQSPAPSRSHEEVPPSEAPVDPIVALDALLAKRETCFRQLSVECLADVDQNGSGALADDTQLIRALRGGGDMPERLHVNAEGARVTESLGDSVIIELTAVGNKQPAPLLLMKGEAGWRIRSLGLR